MTATDARSMALQHCLALEERIGSRRALQPKATDPGNVMETIALEVSPSALPSWRLLPDHARWYIGAFPRFSQSREAFCTPRFTESLRQRIKFSADGGVAGVATRLATAFPQLVRRVTAIALDRPITVYLECEGVHEGMWGDIICPTGRRVTFKEQHRIVAIGGRVVWHRIALDLWAIELQLCGNDNVDPDDTVRMGRVRGEARRGRH
jgi:predicted ester cyclase